MNSFYAELKRRNVVRVGLFYLITGWLILQAGDVLFELLQLPDWTLRLVLGVLMLGFPVVLAFSWIYELTPEGIKLEKDIDRSQSITGQTGQKLNLAIVVGLVLAVGLLAYQQFMPGAPMAESTAVVDDPIDLGEPDAATPAADASPSVAVLPFVNMSDDPKQEYFADGLSDTLMHVLAQVRGLQVAARTSSFAFKGRSVNVSEIAGELGVGTILEGSVQKAGERVRVIAQLIDAESGNHLWSANFDRDLSDIFAIQDEIAREVVAALKVVLLDEDATRLTERYQPSLEAYEQVILGRQQVEMRTAAALAAAEQHFQRAIELDPNYALAYVGLADTYSLQNSYGDLSLEDMIAGMEPLIDRALSLDPLSGQAHTSRGSLLSYMGDYAAAEDAFRRGIELSPSYSRAYHWYSNFLKANVDRFEDALEPARRAMELDPLSPVIVANYADALFRLGQVEKAVSLTRGAIEQHPDFAIYYNLMAGMAWSLGQVGEARRWHQEVLRLNPEGLEPRARECRYMLEMMEDLAAAACLDRLSKAYPNNLPVLSLQFDALVLRDEHDALLRLIDEFGERFMANAAYTRVAHMARGITLARQGDLEGAGQAFRRSRPELFEAGAAAVVSDNWNSALWVAWFQRQTGDPASSEALLAAVEKIIKTRHRTRGAGYGIADVVIDCIRGQREAALTHLREAIDQGWRRDWRADLLHDVRLAPIADDERFAALVEEIRTDILAQREWYEQHKDQPLL